MIDIHAIEGKVRAFILDSFLDGEAAATFSDNADLLAILDSLQILRMLIAFESLFGIKVEDSELIPENLCSVRKVAALVVRKLGGEEPCLRGAGAVEEGGGPARARGPADL